MERTRTQRKNQSLWGTGSVATTCNVAKTSDVGQFCPSHRHKQHGRETNDNRGRDCRKTAVVSDPDVAEDGQGLKTAGRTPLRTLEAFMV